VTVEFVYNNKVQTSTKILPFRANNEQDPCMGFKLRKKGRFERVEEFATRMKEVHEEAEAALKKSQEEMRKYADRKKSEVEEYRVGNWVLLSTKYLKYQMKGRRLVSQTSFCHISIESLLILMVSTAMESP